MKVLRDAAGADGNRVAVVGYDTESDFALELRVDPSTKKRLPPSLLNYDTVQPMLDTLNEIRIEGWGSTWDMFLKVEESGGTAAVGDATYLLAESPRGVAVRLLPGDESSKPGFQLVNFNIEVPAFDPVVRMYKDTLGLKPTKSPPIGSSKVEITLGGGSGAPDLLLSPVPDFRVKERDRDAYEGAIFVAQDPEAMGKKAEEIAVKVLEEEAKKLKQAEAVVEAGGPDADKYQAALDVKLKQGATRAKPSSAVASGKATIDDGVGNILYIVRASEFGGSPAGEAS